MSILIPRVDAEPGHRRLVPHFTSGPSWRSGTMPVVERGVGCYVWDTEGNRYLDGLAGLFCTNVGHGRRELATVAAEQMERMAYFPNWGSATPPTIAAAERIAGLTPGDLDEVFFVGSGSEAVESALKMARAFHVANGEPERYKVIAREWAYHGTTLGALAATAVPKLRAPFLPMLWDGVRHVPNTHGDGPATRVGETSAASLAAIEAMIVAEGPETVSMVIAEPVQNGRGALVPADDYWPKLRTLCDRYGVLLCADEVINAFGRLGHWTASERFGVVPDLLTFAKGVTSAYQPLGGVVARRHVVDTIWDSPMGSFVHGSTFGGHPVATAVAVANIAIIEGEHLLDNVRNNEVAFRAMLDDLLLSYRCVKEVRGAGYFYAVELMADRERGIELDESRRAALQGGVLAGFIRAAGLMIRADDRGATMLMLAPPLVADRVVLADLGQRLADVLARTEEWLAQP